MTRSRLVVLSSFVVAGLGLLVAAGAFFLSPARAAVGPLPPEALALPGDVKFVTGLDVKRFVASPFYQKYAKLGMSRPDAFREIEEKTGLDPERDIDQVIVGGVGRGKDHGVVVVLGRFDRAKLAGLIEKERQGVTWKRHEGAAIYLFGEQGRPGAAGALAFLEDNAMVIGSQAVVEATVTNHIQGGSSLRGNAELMALIASVRPGSTFWMVGDQTLLADIPKSIPAPGAGGSSQVSLPGLKALTARGDLDPVISVEVVGEAADEAAAKNLADVVRGLVALASLQASQKPELKDLASAVSVTTDAHQVRVNARLPYELLDSLTSKARRAPEGVEAK